jgi:hypothetical protein
MQNFDSFQFAIFYVLVGIFAVLGLFAIIVTKSSVRYYIMFSSRVIFRNFEFVNGEIILIGNQQDDERLKDLISVQKLPSEGPNSNIVQARKTADNSLDEFDENYDSLDLSLMSSENPDEDYLAICDDLDVNKEIEQNLGDSNFSAIILEQKNSLVEIKPDFHLKALMIIEKQIEISVASFLPHTELHVITNSFDIDLCHEMEQQDFPEANIEFYRTFGIRLITSRFEDFLLASKQVKEEIIESEKKKMIPHSMAT